MKGMFEPFVIGGMELKNRLVRSATFEYREDDNGTISEYMAEVHRKLAEGGVGLIISGMMAVGRNAVETPGMAWVGGTDFSRKLRGLTDIAHSHGAKLVVQLSNCGAKATVLDDPNPYAPSDITVRYRQPAKAMTEAEIKSLAEDFGRAAAACKEAGADGVQIHGAHGYLISQFISPYFNKRNDRYGGPIENRGRLLLEIVESIREKTGRDYPLLVKINYSDLLEESVTGDECVWLCAELEKKGVDAIEISAGISVDKASSVIRIGCREQGFNADYAIRVAEAVSIPVISVGGYRSPGAVEDALKRGKIAAISMSRALICDPGLPELWRKGDRRESDCVSCNRCFKQPKLQCVLRQPAGQE